MSARSSELSQAADDRLYEDQKQQAGNSTIGGKNRNLRISSKAQRKLVKEFDPTANEKVDDFRLAIQIPSMFVSVSTRR